MPYTLKIDLNGGQIATLDALTTAPLSSVRRGRRVEFIEALTRIASLLPPYGSVDYSEKITLKLNLTRYEKAALHVVLIGEAANLNNPHRSDRTPTFSESNAVEILRLIGDYEEALAALQLAPQSANEGE